LCGGGGGAEGFEGRGVGHGKLLKCKLEIAKCKLQNAGNRTQVHV